MKEIIPWILSALTIYTMFLAGDKKRNAWIVGLINQALWLMWILNIHAWGLLPMNLALWVVYSRNLKKWSANHGDMADTYVFDLKDGGRHHPFTSLEQLRKDALEEVIGAIKQEIKEPSPYNEVLTHPQEQWMEERRKEIYNILGGGLGSEAHYDKLSANEKETVTTIVDRLLTLLTTQIEAAERRVLADAKAVYLIEKSPKDGRKPLTTVEEWADRRLASLTNHN